MREFLWKLTYLCCIMSSNSVEISKGDRTYWFIRSHGISNNCFTYLIGISAG